MKKQMMVLVRDYKFKGELPRSKLRSIKDKKTKTAVADVTFYNLC